MHFVKFFVVFVALTGTVCFSETIKVMNVRYYSAKLEEAAIKIVTNCYANEDKTILLAGSFSGDFIKSLSSHKSFSLVLLNHERTGKSNNTIHPYIMLKRKVHILLIKAPIGGDVRPIINLLLYYLYFDNMAFTLVIPSLTIKNIRNDSERREELMTMLFDLNYHHILNVNVLHYDTAYGTVIFSSNPFEKHAPEPWVWVFTYYQRKVYPPFTFYLRGYRDTEETCKNLNFDKTRDAGGFRVVTARTCNTGWCTKKLLKYEDSAKSRRAKITLSRNSVHIEYFFTYVNLTEKIEWIELALGKEYDHSDNWFHVPVSILRVRKEVTYAYPYDVVCVFMVTQFRGNKSQLEKIISVIDGYSWIGLLGVYFVTLLFFKYFLGLSLNDALMNLVRLTCNWGLSTTPRNLSSQIYLACLLFVVVTMQGIFVGNLAALLTEDVAIQQVNSIEALVALGYTLFVPRIYLQYFEDIVPKELLFARQSSDTCLDHILGNPMIACLDLTPDTFDNIQKYNLYVSDCISADYLTNAIPRLWAFEERFNKYLGIIVSGGFLMDLDTMVDEKRLNEAESAEMPAEPRKMNLRDLCFAFIILGIGLVFASVTFLIEIVIYRYRSRVRKTRVVALN